VTYPGATLGTDPNGGSHIGHGGVGPGVSGSTYGSIYRPQEAGSGANSNNGPGGGIVRINAGGLVFGDATSAIRANGQGTGDKSGAGGSIWVTVAGLSGDGVMEAHGGQPGYQPSGGGGAIAIEYGSVSGTVLSNLTAAAGNTASGTGRFGSAGSIYLKGP